MIFTPGGSLTLLQYCAIVSVIHNSMKMKCVPETKFKPVSSDSVISLYSAFHSALLNNDLIMIAEEKGIGQTPISLWKGSDMQEHWLHYKFSLISELLIHLSFPKG